MNVEIDIEKKYAIYWSTIRYKRCYSLPQLGSKSVSFISMHSFYRSFAILSFTFIAKAAVYFILDYATTMFVLNACSCNVI